MEHCDHLKPSAWKCDLVACSCDPQAAWSTSCACAEEILQVHHFITNFTEVFSHKNVDMLHPFSDDIYSGICADPNPSVSVSSELPLLTGHEPIDDNRDEDCKDESWCCSLSHHLKCIVAVLHSHSGKTSAENLSQ